MAFNSQSGQVGFGLQTVAGTPVAASQFYRMRSGSMGIERELLIPDPEIGGNRDVNSALLGPVAYVGDYEFYPRSLMIAQLLYAVMGSQSTTNNTTYGTHELTPGTTIPWLTIEETIGNDFETIQYSDCKVNTLRMEADAAGYLMGSCNIIGKTSLTGFSKNGTPTWDNNPLFVGSSVDITLGGASFPGKTFSFELSNNLESDDFVLGSIELDQITEKRRSLTCGFSIRPSDSTRWKAAMHGATGQTTPQAGAAFEQALVIDINTYENISGAATPHNINISIPNAVIAPYSATPSGDDTLQTDFEVTGIRPAAGTPLVTVTVDNDYTTDVFTA